MYKKTTQIPGEIVQNWQQEVDELSAGVAALSQNFSEHGQANFSWSAFAQDLLALDKEFQEVEGSYAYYFQNNRNYQVLLQTYTSFVFSVLEQRALELQKEGGLGQEQEMEELENVLHHVRTCYPNNSASNLFDVHLFLLDVQELDDSLEEENQELQAYLAELEEDIPRNQEKHEKLNRVYKELTRRIERLRFSLSLAMGYFFPKGEEISTYPLGAEKGVDMPLAWEAALGEKYPLCKQVCAAYVALKAKYDRYDLFAQKVHTKSLTSTSSPEDSLDGPQEHYSSSSSSSSPRGSRVLAPAPISASLSAPVSTKKVESSSVKKKRVPQSASVATVPATIATPTFVPMNIRRIRPRDTFFAKTSRPPSYSGWEIFSSICTIGAYVLLKEMMESKKIKDKYKNLIAFGLVLGFAATAGLLGIAAGLVKAGAEIHQRRKEAEVEAPRLLRN